MKPPQEGKKIIPSIKLQRCKDLFCIAVFLNLAGNILIYYMSHLYMQVGRYMTFGESIARAFLLADLQSEQRRNSYLVDKTRSFKIWINML